MFFVKAFRRLVLNYLFFIHVKIVSEHCVFRGHYCVFIINNIGRLLALRKDKADACATAIFQHLAFSESLAS